MSIRIILIRHGETEWNRTRRFQGREDIPLNDNGKAQAGALAGHLKEEAITAIHSSVLKRAMETATIIHAFHKGVPLVPEEGIIEMDLGEFDGMDATVWLKKYPGFMKKWMEAPADISMPNGENLFQVQSRAVKTVEQIVSRYPDQSTLLISSHNFVNLTILCYAKGIPLDRFREVPQDTAALNILSKKGTSWHVEVVNDRSHLEGMSAH
jgi:probable phosphoglycerate mutase